jgi:hypothetical protein
VAEPPAIPLAAAEGSAGLQVVAELPVTPLVAAEGSAGLQVVAELSETHLLKCGSENRLVVAE